MANQRPKPDAPVPDKNESEEVLPRKSAEMALDSQPLQLEKAEMTSLETIAEAIGLATEGVIDINAFRSTVRQELPKTLAEAEAFYQQLQRMASLANLTLQMCQEVLATIPGR